MLSEEKESFNILEKSSDKTFESFTISSFSTKKDGYPSHFFLVLMNAQNCLGSDNTL